MIAILAFFLLSGGFFEGVLLNVGVILCSLMLLMIQGGIGNQVMILPVALGM